MSEELDRVETYTIARDSMVFVDAHVHIHNCFELESFLQSAADNLVCIRDKVGADQCSAGILLLTETSKANYFTRLSQLADSSNRQFGNLSIHRTNEDCSLLVEFMAGQKLVIVAGRQIVTTEKLEVLALGTTKHFQDDEPIVKVIDKVQAEDALAVVPWGFGKWLGQRGKIVDSLLENINGRSFYLGDNSGRPALIPEPRHFVKAREKGIAILPGSDPLPFASEFYRPGSFGFSIPGRISDNTPTLDLKELLRENTMSIAPYGRLENPFRFLKNQFAMQIVKHNR